MHLIRRAAFRAAGAASTFTSAPRSFTTRSSTFAVRSNAQSIISPSVFRRFNSDEAKPVEQKLEDAEASFESSQEAAAHAGEGEAVDAFFESSQEAAAHAGEGEAVKAEQDYFGTSERDARSNRSFRKKDSRRDQSGAPGSRSNLIMPPTSAIYVGNLLFEATAADLEREFAEFGPIKSTTIATDARGLSKGFGYIEFESVEQARSAIEAKNQMTFEGRRLIVNYMAKSKRPLVESAPSKTLFIGNLAFELSDADLNKLFRDIRNVLDVRVAIDRRTGQPRGFAHADFVDVESATKGLEALQGKEVYGRKLRVDYSAVPDHPARRPAPNSY